MKISSWTIALLAVAGAPAAAQWTKAGGGNHGETDWTPQHGDVIAGVHTFVRTFTIASGTTVDIDQEDGRVVIHAQTIRVAGTLNGVGRGLPGGASAYLGMGCGTRAGDGVGPGGGQGGYSSTCFLSLTGGGAGGGYGGSGGNGAPECHCPCSPSVGGAVSGTDSDTDYSAGSGGGGAAVYYSNFPSPGASGGAAVALLACFQIMVDGAIDVSGQPGGNGLIDYNAGGGGGSGGAMVLQAGESVAVTGTLRANGGKGGDAHTWYSSGGGGGGGGGRIKLFSPLIGTKGATITVTGGTGGVSGSRCAFPSRGEAGSAGTVHESGWTPLKVNTRCGPGEDNSNGDMGVNDYFCSGGAPAAPGPFALWLCVAVILIAARR